MFISKNDYKDLIAENTYLKLKIREQGVRIADLLREIDNLNIELYTINDKCFDVTLHLHTNKTIKYTINAESTHEASSIAIEQYEKDNLNYSKSDIAFIRIDEI